MQILTEQDYSNAANLMKVDVPTVKAVGFVESSGNGFLADGRPVILFESAVFSRLTNHKYDESDPAISTRGWVDNYGDAGVHQWDRLAQAIGVLPAVNHLVVNAAPALESCSWGAFQIMGFNYAVSGYPDVMAFVRQMRVAYHQLESFTYICITNGWDLFLRRHDWLGFALRYNGAMERRNDYDQRLAAAYNAYSEGKEP
jgi:hypothetical protein